MVQQLGLSTCSFSPNGLGIRPSHVPGDLRLRGGRMYREGWKQKEIRVAIDSPSGAYDDDPEQAGDSKPGERSRRAG